MTTTLKMVGDRGSTCVTPPVPFAGIPVIDAHYLHYDEAAPIPEEQAEGPDPHTIPYEDIYTYLLTQGVVSLTEIEKYLIYYLLPHGCQILEQLGLEGGGPCSSTLSEAMEGIMIDNDQNELAVDNPRHGIP